MSAIDALLEEPGAAVTYKFLARHLDVSANLAKKLLFAHVARSAGASVATHVVSGWVKSGDTRAHVVRLARGVDGEVEAARKAMDEVTGEHVYSVAKATGSSEDHPVLASVPPASTKQTDELFDAPPETPNALRDNRHSAVACALVKRAEGPARRVTKTTAPAPATALAAKPAVKTEAKKTEAKGPGPFAGFKPVAKSDVKPEPKPAAAKPAAKPAGGGKGAMAAMFAKAPPKKAAAPAPPPPAPVQDEDMSEEEVLGAPIG